MITAVYLGRPGIMVHAVALPLGGMDGVSLPSINNIIPNNNGEI